MPLYQYECRRHGEFTDWASMEMFDKARPCPKCGKLAKRAISAAYLGMDSNIRKAFHSSEKSAHEPRVVRRRRGDPIPTHDAHADLSRVRNSLKSHHHQHSGHQQHGHSTAVRSKHPWLVRH
jgi:putative FmdB family regulatory protein